MDGYDVAIAACDLIQALGYLAIAAVFVGFFRGWFA
jgi:hypothetical protein